MKLESLSAKEIGDLVNSRSISALDVVNYFLDRIERYNDRVNAVTYLMPEYAKNAAKQLDDKIAQGYQAPFAGVPFLLKDFLDSKKGWTNSHGGVEALVRVDRADSEFCKAAEKLGAIAIGKANAPAFGFSGQCDNKMYGSTRNPFDTSRTSGGSSGGSAAAVASGLVPIAEGGDAGGSIRIPACWCNLFGFKPSLGTVPSYCRPDGWTATHPYCFNGSLVKTVEDCAILLTQMAQYNPKDPISLPINSDKDFVDLMKKDVRNFKIGFTLDFGLWRVSDQVSSHIHDFLIKFGRSFSRPISSLSFDFRYKLEDILRCWAWAISVDTAIDLHIWKCEGLDLVRDHRDQLPEEFIKFNEIARDASILDMREFNEIRTDILDNLEDAFENVDVILSPTAICEPKVLGDTSDDSPYNFINFAETPIVNFVGYPAASVPIGLTKNGLPVGIQVIGKQYHDEDVLAVANAIEKTFPWRPYYEKSYLS